MKREKVIVSQHIMILLCFMMIAFCGFAEAASGGNGKGQASEKDKLTRVGEKGQFSVQMMLAGKDIDVGANSFDLVVRDRRDREVAGAAVSVVPWMPEQGHGVWEKPVVTDMGKGIYHVENVALIISGQWDLRITIKKGDEEDNLVFSFLVGGSGKVVAGDAGKPKEEYVRTIEYYKVPNVTLLNQDGKQIKLRSFLDAGKPVIIDFIYATCTTICPILSAGFSSIRDELGENAQRVQLVSISIDPEHDRPEQLMEYLERYSWGKGWDFLTGSREDINLVLKAFDASVADKMAHLPLYIFHGSKSDEWVRIKGLIGTADLMRELKRIENK